MSSLSSNDIEEVDHGDVLNSSNYFGNILTQSLSRRDVMRGGLSAAIATSFVGSGLAACSNDVDMGPVVNTKNVSRSLADAVMVPSDYSVAVLFATGDVLNGAGNDKALDTITGSEMASRSGDHHDGMYYFGLNTAGGLDRNGSDRGLLAINFENINQQFLHSTGATRDAGGKRTVADEVVKEINSHGVGLVEIAKTNGNFAVVNGSTLSRRITPETPARFAGPVAGSKWVKTKYSPDGTISRGTLNNCAYGYTPWGTYLTCEENWAGYFDNANTATPPVEYSRYGIVKSQNGNYRWATAGTDDRFVRWQLAPAEGAAADGSADYRNEANTFGWVLEIDPLNNTPPVKRSTFGRMAHECAYPSVITAGKKFAFYQGDDSRFEYIYKFVPNAAWDPADAALGMAAGDKYLNNGVLYVAKFNDNNTGTWIPVVAGQGPLTAANGFADQAEVLVKTRAAADALGATNMDRPEWCTVDHTTGDVYISLTNNTSRGDGKADQIPETVKREDISADAANPRNVNTFGHIMRIRETGSDPAATTFKWGIFVFGSPATNTASNISQLTADNDFSSPDGLWADPRGLLWIQTDNTHTNEMGLLCNEQMLVTIPPADMHTPPVIKRFLVGPAQCELTGVDITPDGKTMFCNIQHPGEDTAAADLATPAKYGSAWPYDRNDASKVGTKAQRPRSATLVITRKDGGVIGF